MLAHNRVLAQNVALFFLRPKQGTEKFEVLTATSAILPTKKSFDPG